MKDKILLNAISAETIIGVRPSERESKQRVLISLELSTDLRLPGKTDNLEDTLDYSSLKNTLVEYAEHSTFFLLEALARGIAEICLAQNRVSAVQVKVEKPDVYSDAESVGVIITRNSDSRISG